MDIIKLFVLLVGGVVINGHHDGTKNHHGIQQGVMQGCTDKSGKKYVNGERMPSGDSCNSCYCSNGMPACTLLYCPPPDQPSKTPRPQQVTSCKDKNGKEYENGESMPSNDTCNTCACMNGIPVCTTKICGPFSTTTTPRPKEPKSCKHKNGKIYKLGEGVPSGDSCNTCTCRDGDVYCTTEECKDHTTKKPAGGKPCSTKGSKIYIDGENIPSGDLCNTCTCRDGDVMCTVIKCVETTTTKPPGGKPCSTKGSKIYNHGQAVPSSDPCQACICNDGRTDCKYVGCSKTNLLQGGTKQDPLQVGIKQNPSQGSTKGVPGRRDVSSYV